MAECVKLAKCPFFHDQMVNMPSTSEYYKNLYCKGDHAKCARFKVSSAGKNVPPDLFPNQADRAQKLIAG